jgi:hypothetical protein
MRSYKDIVMNTIAVGTGDSDVVSQKALNVQRVQYNISSKKQAATH